MRLRATSPLLGGWEAEASLSTGHNASSYGGAVLLVDGEPVGPVEAALTGYEVLEATPEELDALTVAGYLLKLPEKAQETKPTRGHRGSPGGRPPTAASHSERVTR